MKTLWRVECWFNPSTSHDERVLNVSHCEMAWQELKYSDGTSTGTSDLYVVDAPNKYILEAHLWKQVKRAKNSELLVVQRKYGQKLIKVIRSGYIAENFKRRLINENKYVVRTYL